MTSAGGLATAILPREVPPVTRSRAKAQAEFQKLWDEGHVAGYLCDYTLATIRFEEAYQVGRSLASSYQAKALEEMASVRETTAGQKNVLQEDEERVKAEPVSIPNRLCLAARLFCLGRYDEAEVAYQKVLSRGAELNLPENKEYWPSIGWYYFRFGNYRQAAEWFERTPECLHVREGCAVTKHGLAVTPEERLLRQIEADSTLNRLLAAAALGNDARARALASLYVTKLGERLPHAHRWHLEHVGIDADAIYADWYSQLG